MAKGFWTGKSIPVNGSSAASPGILDCFYPPTRSAHYQLQIARDGLSGLCKVPLSYVCFRVIWSSQQQSFTLQTASFRFSKPT